MPDRRDPDPPLPSDLEHELARELAQARAQVDRIRPEEGAPAPEGGEAAAIAAGKWVVPDRPRRLVDPGPSPGASPHGPDGRAGSAPPGFAPSPRRRRPGTLSEQPPSSEAALTFRDRLHPQAAAGLGGENTSPLQGGQGEARPRQRNPKATSAGYASLLLLVAGLGFVAGRLSGPRSLAEPAANASALRSAAAALLTTLEKTPVQDDDPIDVIWAEIARVAGRDAIAPSTRASPTPQQGEPPPPTAASPPGRTTEALALRALLARLEGQPADEFIRPLKRRTLANGALPAHMGAVGSPRGAVTAILALGVHGSPLAADDRDHLGRWAGALLLDPATLRALPPDDQSLVVVVAARLTEAWDVRAETRDVLTQALAARALAGPEPGLRTRSAWPALEAAALAQRGRLPAIRTRWQARTREATAEFRAWADRLAQAPRPSAQVIAEALLGLRELQRDSR